MLAALGLTGLALESPAAALSDGYKRRLALAVQLTRGPALLLLDEPLAGLDWASRADIAQLLGAVSMQVMSDVPAFLRSRVTCRHFAAAAENVVMTLLYMQHLSICAPA